MSSLRQALSYMLKHRGAIVLSWVLSAIQLMAYVMTLWLMVDVLQRLFGYSGLGHGLIFLELVDIEKHLTGLFGKLTTGADQQTALVASLLTMGTLFILMQAARFGRLLLLFRANLQAVSEIRTDLFRALMRVSLDEMAMMPTGRANSLLVNDVNQMRSGFIDVFDRLFHQPLQLVLFVYLLHGLSPSLLLNLLWVLPLSLGLIALIGALTKKLVRRSLERIEELEALIIEALTQIKLVKSYGGEDHECRRFDRHNTAYFRGLYRLDVLFLLRGVSFKVLTMLMLGGVALIGGLKVMSGELDVDTYIRFLVLMPGTVVPLESLSTIVSSLLESQAAASRVFVVVNRHPEVPVASGATVPEARSGIEFRHVSVSRGGRDILHDVSFTIAPGERVALVGPSGAGKSTMISALLGLVPVHGGQVLVDDVDVDQIDEQYLRRNIHAVLQEESLFNTTLGENLCYPGRRFTEDEVLRAAGRVQAAELITGRPQGLGGLVGHRGSTFSGGEVQRLAVSRALLGDPGVLLLDEALSGLDAETERAVLDDIVANGGDQTVVLATHRLSSVTRLDRVILMDAGRIVDDGSHAELMERCPLYEALIRLQSLAEETR